MITGSITSMLANSDVSSTQRREKMNRVRNYMHSHSVPEDLATTIIGFYDYLWKTDHRDEDLFNDLTDSLKLRLTIATKRHFIHSCSVFHTLDQFAVVRLITALRQVICVPLEIVAAQGEIGTSMYFVSHGELEASCMDDEGNSITVGHLYAGDHFGEAAILEPDGRRNATVRAATFCELFALRFDELFVSGDEDRAIILAITADINQRRIIRDIAKRLVRMRNRLHAFACFSKSLKRLRAPASGRETKQDQGKGKGKGKGVLRFMHAARVGRTMHRTLQATTNVMHSVSNLRGGSVAHPPAQLQQQRSNHAFHGNLPSADETPVEEVGDAAPLGSPGAGAVLEEADY